MSGSGFPLSVAGLRSCRSGVTPFRIHQPEHDGPRGLSGIVTAAPGAPDASPRTRRTQPNPRSGPVFGEPPPSPGPDAPRGMSLGGATGRRGTLAIRGTVGHPCRYLRATSAGTPSAVRTPRPRGRTSSPLPAGEMPIDSTIATRIRPGSRPPRRSRRRGGWSKAILLMGGRPAQRRGRRAPPETAGERDRRRRRSRPPLRRSRRRRRSPRGPRALRRFPWPEGSS